MYTRSKLEQTNKNANENSVVLEIVIYILFQFSRFKFKDGKGNVGSTPQVHGLSFPAKAVGRKEQDLLEILDLELFDVKTLVLILIEPSLATFVLLGYCLI